MANADLMNAFSFTAPDLYTNRQGHLTQRQINRLWRMSFEASILPAIFLMLSIALLSVTLRDFNLLNQPDNLRLNVLGAGTLVLVCVAFGVWRWVRIASDALAANVRTLEGKISLGALQTRNIGYYGTGYRVTVNNTGFIIPSAARTALTEGKRYRLYFTPQAKIILSIERA